MEPEKLLWAAAAGNSHIEESWKLLEYLGSETAQKKQAELGVTMSAYMGTSDAWVNCAPEFHLQAYLDMTESVGGLFRDNFGKSILFRDDNGRGM